MKDQYISAVKLLKTSKYNTYQFYAEMADHNTRCEDGLKIAALTCLSWLRDRLEGNEIPEVLKMPEADEYKKVSNDRFISFSIEEEYIINVISDIEEGLWALRIIESDLGALEGSKPVAGRTIHSDIAFRIVEGKLECGFRTVVSDSEQVEKADCVRFSVVKELGLNNVFGLRQINRLYRPDRMNIGNDEEFDEVFRLYKNSNNQLPFIFYTYDDYSDSDDSIFKTDLKAMQEESIRKNVFSKAEAYSNRYLGIARPYFLPKRMFERFSNSFNYDHFDIDDVVIVEPRKYVGKINVYPYEDKDSYRNVISNFSRGRDIDFHDVLFVDEARVIVERKDSNYISNIISQLDETTRNLDEVKNRISKIDRVNEYAINKNNVKDNKELEKALSDLRESENRNIVLEKEIKRLQNELDRKNDYLSYVRRKEKRPVKHSEIADWASMFEYLAFDKQAIDCLERKDAVNVDIDTICDSLDYLGHLYARHLFEDMSEEELNDHSSNIYGRPYEVSPSGIDISAKSNCKIKYDLGDGNRKEIPLDWHLKVGNHGEIIRVYFIIDRNRKKIVIGSLPNHLVY